MAESLPARLVKALEPVVAEVRSGNGDLSLPVSLLPLLAFLAHNPAQKKSARQLWVVSDDATALDFVRAWNSLHALSHTDTEYAALVSWGVIPYSFTAPDKEKEYQRTRAEFLMRSELPCLVVASIEGLTQFIAADTDPHAHARLVTPGSNVNRQELTEYLAACGYTHQNPVTKPGEFCVKGSIIDVFPPDEDSPVRLDFFGDEVETIKAFSHETQRSFGSLDEVRISALRPPITGLEKEIADFLAKQKSLKGELPPVLTTHGSNLAGYADLYPALRQCLPAYALWKEQVFICDEEAIAARLNTLNTERRYLYERSDSPVKIAPAELFADAAGTAEFLSKGTRFLPEAEDDAAQWSATPRYGGRLGLLKDYLDSREAGSDVFYFIGSEGQRERLSSALTDYPQPQILPWYYPHGFRAPGITVFTENDIFGRVVKKYAADKNISRLIESYTDLKEGDYVVHVNYGIGRFAALRRMRVQNTERDFLELRFADEDKLFVPLDQLNLVHKYIGSTENPRLDHLGKKSSWAKTRARVKRIVDSIAQELIELYAQRLEQKGFNFPPDSSFQHDFEAAFPFTETEHQLEAIQAIKQDMESDKAMDRLVCGDVGFGKTEVAIRAAFKAAMAGKQVVVLCPTTILAFQHYRSFSKRFADYPVRIDYISRFRTAGEIAETKKKLAEGKLDIVIGTHALLSDDIKYKSLGLLIVDEEQRFGVGHKEKLRQLRHNLDCLALTATPIPRTLHMSLSGIRDLSIIETPPADRRKIETHVLQENEEVLRLAIKHELDRGGQVYVLHNKVKTIEEQALRLRSLAPRARVAVLHGQMPENEIEEIMVDFYQHAYDLLVSTTIIESGIDIPNVNTLVVLGAHEFGLSQLYQLKGRVGRSDRQAYAYFFYPPPSISPLSNEAERRLEVLAEYDDLGSGFRIAMKDLEIRGAGNLLGKEQSGEILEIGFELYSQMLNDKIQELRGQKRESDDFNCAVTLPCDWYFPDDYIADTRAKMEFYKSISSAQNTEEYLNIREALTDRFGKPPEIVELMLLFEEIRHLANALRLEKIALDTETGTPYFIVAPTHRLDMERVSSLLTRDKRVRLDTTNAKRINLQLQMTPQVALFRELRALLRFLGSLA
ncbi:MAG TPA: transcription-repair coupling factor [Turneriella sp.]|nr:transcription-repair coupling factor [Turneriella sp.]